MLKIVGARLEQTHSLYARQSAVALLGKVKPSEPRQLAEVVVGLLRVYLDSPEFERLAKPWGPRSVRRRCFGDDLAGQF